MKDLLEGLINGLIVAFILWLFGIDNIIINGINELINVQITINGYYVIFCILGVLSKLL